MRRSLMILTTVIGLMAGSATLPAAAPARAEAPGRQCFFQQQVDNFRAGATPTLYLKVRGSGVYAVSTGGGCTDLDIAYRLAIVPDAGSSRLCTDDFVTLSTAGSTGSPQTCRARIEKKLTDEEVAALPARSRP